MHSEGSPISEWRQITCDERDDLYGRENGAWSVGSGLTDLDGEFGDPHMFTEWWDGDQPVLRDYRWPQPSGEKPDTRPCEHYVPSHPHATPEPTS